MSEDFFRTFDHVGLPEVVGGMSIVRWKTLLGYFTDILFIILFKSILIDIVRTKLLGSCVQGSQRNVRVGPVKARSL